MYGLVNKGVERMVRGTFGNDTWHRVREDAGVEDEPFLSMRMYPDSMTWDLVQSASVTLEMEPDAVLRAFGHYFIRYSAEEGYGQMLSLFGADLQTFLSNLDELHARIGLSFPEIDPPLFSLDSVGEKKVHLHYQSHRRGLGDFVLGLVEGLAERFNETVSVTYVVKQVDGADHDIFAIRWESAA